MLVDGLLKIGDGASQLVDLVFGPVKLQAVNAHQEDISEREEYVEHERDRHREQRRQAPAGRRATWWLRDKLSTDDDGK